jgi:anti-anti-sigma regulatory factor
VVQEHEPDHALPIRAQWSGQVIQARHTLPARCPLVLRGPQPIVRRVFEVTGLDQICIIE